jgi:FHA domain
MSRLQKLERRIDEKLRRALRSSSPEQTLEPIEVHRAILDEISSRIDTLPRGRLSFGYSHVDVRVLIQNPERRRSYEIVFLEADSVARDIRTRFEERRVEFPSRLKIDVELVDSLPPDVSDRGFDVSYSNPAGSPQALDTTQVQLTVLVGNAEQKEYCFTKRRINLGRLAEVLDSDLRMVRRNDLPLNDDSTAANSTVSRAHAHLEYDPDASRFRLFDDGSAHGTTVVREGAVIPVPKGTSKGVLLERGDEILLGKVYIRFE